MEILVRGVNPQEKFWFGECGNCKSILKSKRTELTRIEGGGQRDGGYWAIETCPVCKKAVHFYEEGNASANSILLKVKV